MSENDAYHPKIVTIDQWDHDFLNISEHGASEFSDQTMSKTNGGCGCPSSELKDEQKL